MTRIHATCLAIRGRGVLIAGPSGSGKSDLALRLLDRGAVLVSDDYTELRAEGDRLIASAPAAIAGRMEVRGIGIVSCETVPAVAVALRVEAGEPQRMPDATFWAMMDISIPMIRLALLESSSPLKVELALDQLA